MFGQVNLLGAELNHSLGVMTLAHITLLIDCLELSRAQFNYLNASIF